MPGCDTGVGGNAESKRTDAPNSHYSSTGVRNQGDRERWGDIKTGVLHPLSADEIGPLLDVGGVKSRCDEGKCGRSEIYPASAAVATISTT